LTLRQQPDTIVFVRQTNIKELLKMKKLKQLNGYVIAELSEREKENYIGGYSHLIFTKDEWYHGGPGKYPEHEADSFDEALQFCQWEN
jgi:hypothetical protein